MKKEVVYCGVDLHHRKSSFCFMDEKGGIQLQTEIPTQKEDIAGLVGKYNDCDLNYAFEAGGMARYFHQTVKDLKNTKKIHVVHPLKFKIITESKTKTDKEDSKKLAWALLKDNLPFPVHIKSESSRKLQVLLGIRMRKVQTAVRIVNQAKSIIRAVGGKTGRFVHSSPKAFERAIEAISGEKEEKQVLRLLYEEYLAEERKIEEDNVKIMEMVKKEYGKEYELLNTIPGIGFITAAAIIAITDGIDRFDNARQFSSYCGLIPSEHSSGTKVVHGRITKQGSKILRHLLVQAGWRAIRERKDGDRRMLKMRGKYFSISFRQKCSQKAVVAVARRLSRIVFAVLKYRQPYSGDLGKTREMALVANRLKAC